VTTLKYILGIDGGGTKTRAQLSDETGQILADSTAGPSNHHMIGPDSVKFVINSLIKDICAQHEIAKSDIDFCYLGLSGADLPDDFIILNAICAECLGSVPFKVTNDAWIIMRSGLLNSWGAVSIYGTGANAGAVHPDGRESILRALTYELGGGGGGSFMSYEALHHTFRSNEGTGPKTLLEFEIPKLYGFEDIEELLKNLYPEPIITEKDFALIPPLIFKLADVGDHVCLDLLDRLGTMQGDMVVGMIQKLEMENFEIPVVLGGSIYNGTNPTLIDSMMRRIHEVVPEAFSVIPEMPPVSGAILAGMDMLEVPVNESIVNNIKQAHNKG